MPRAEFLGLMGVRAEIGTTAAVNRDGTPAPDLRIGPMSTEGGLTVRVTNSESAWARAGLNTGDRLVSINDSRVSTWIDLRRWLQTARIGDTARVVVVRDGVERQIDIPVVGYTIPTVRLIELSSATPKHVRIRDAWSAAN